MVIKFMRICVVGDFSNNHDEGFKNIAFYLTKEISKKHEVLKLNIKKIYTLEFWRELKKFNPQLIHHLTAPTVYSFIVLKLISTQCKNAKTIMSSLHPQLFQLSEKLIPYVKPDLMLIQSQEDKIRFEKLGVSVKFLPNGVDNQKFIPVSQEIKIELRKKYGIDKEKFTILHVGHIRLVRNLQILPNIVEKTDQVLIVASTYMKLDTSIYNDLKNAGCIIWLGYLESIEEIYSMCDCYVFPVSKKHSILTPLSVLEAMSCNIPVITNKFAGLETFFNEGDGLYFAEREEDFINLINDLKNLKSEKVENRKKISSFSWISIAKQMDEIYENTAK